MEQNNPHYIYFHLPMELLGKRDYIKTCFRGKLEMYCLLLLPKYHSQDQTLVRSCHNNAFSLNGNRGSRGESLMRAVASSFPPSHRCVQACRV